VFHWGCQAGEVEDDDEGEGEEVKGEERRRGGGRASLMEEIKTD
jgi:hypothetical protein